MWFSRKDVLQFSLSLIPLFEGKQDLLDKSENTCMATCSGGTTRSGFGIPCNRRTLTEGCVCLKTLKFLIPK